MRDVPYAALQVLFYTRIKAAAIESTGHTSSHPVVQLIAGGSAAASATLVTHPFGTHLYPISSFPYILITIITNQIYLVR
jgi:hypothetical protein